MAGIFSFNAAQICGVLIPALHRSNRRPHVIPAAPLDEFDTLKRPPASPHWRRAFQRRLPRLTQYTVRDPRWTPPPLRIGFVSDLHVGAPWVTLDHVSRIVDQVNAQEPDIILLGGDYLADRNLRHVTARASAAEIVARLAPLSASLGVHAILGNHDWKGCDLAVETKNTRNSVIEAFAAAGRPVLRNQSRHIPHGTDGFWLVGTDSQRAIENADGTYTSFLDADAAFAEVPEGAPAIHLAHEPDYFATNDSRAVLQISGHTHGGQVKVYGRTPIVPSAFGDRYAVGHIQDSDNHLIVSCGIGYSGLPLRVGVPPETVLITVGN